MALYPVFTAQQSLNQTARHMARTIELYGKADDETLQSVTADGSFLAPESVDVEAEWHNAAEKVSSSKRRLPSP